MTVLVADDHETNRKLLGAVLSAEGYKVEEAKDGGEALAALQKTSEPMVALLDWQMPVLPGVDVCREARKGANANPLFLIMLTVRDSPKDVVEGLQAGANDYVTKPFDNTELLARVAIGKQMVELQQSLIARVRELEEAMGQIKRLRGLLPICCYCKKIRDDKNYWQEVDRYISTHSEAKFSHGICPACLVKHSEELGLTKEHATGFAARQAQESQ
jgi:phosphoserine phosphatase RsbU/P